MPRRISPAPHPAQPPASPRLTWTSRAGALAPGLLDQQVNLVLQEWTGSSEHTEQTRLRMSETVLRFSRRAAACGLTSLAATSTADARAFITAPTRYGAAPELATQHARRTAVRTLFRTARRLGLVTGDPTLDVSLPPRGALAARPLTDDEVTLCRASAHAVRGTGAGLRAAAWALGEATAVSSEITAVRVCDLDDPREPGWVRLPGTRRHDPRTVELTAWGSVILGRRAARLLADGDEQTLLAYGGHAPPGGAKAQASVCNALRAVLTTAGLLDEDDIRPASLRHWAGRSAYDTGLPLEAVARMLGHRSLDATAEDIALTWRTDPPSEPPATSTARHGTPLSRHTDAVRHLAVVAAQEAQR